MGDLRVWCRRGGRTRAPRNDLRPVARGLLAEYDALLVLMDVSPYRPARVSEAMLREWERVGATYEVTTVQSFGELADDSTTTHCSDMANGKFGSTFTNPPDATGATDPSYFGSVSLYLGNVPTAYTAIANTNSAWFDSGFLSARTYAVGGPGFGGNTGSC
jgi:hypothetical protein